MSQKRIALVADWITHWGGAERVFAKLMEMYPEADIYTSVFFPARPEVFEGRRVHTSFIQYIPFFNRRHKFCMLFRPLAFARFDFSEYDIVISSTSAEAKGIITKRNKNKAKRILSWFKTGNSKLETQNFPIHICYCHTPTRYLWSHTSAYRGFLEFGWLNWFAKLIIPTAFTIMRRWDKKAAQRPDIFIANSVTTRDRIAEYYDRESHIVYPFLAQSEELKTKNEERKYFMCLGRVVPYKKFDIAVEACNALKVPLKIFTSTKNAVTDKLQKLS